MNVIIGQSSRALVRLFWFENSLGQHHQEEEETHQEDAAPEAQNARHDGLESKVRVRVSEVTGGETEDNFTLISLWETNGPPGPFISVVSGIWLY